MVPAFHNTEAGKRIDMNSIDVSHIVDDARFGNVHLKIIIACALLLIVDGYDVFIYGVFLPHLMEQWNLSAPEAGSLASWAHFGMMPGALLFGPLGDRIGRKKCIALCFTLFSTATFINGFATTPTTFGVFRFLAGLGCGGLMPNAVALANEFAAIASIALPLAVVALTGQFLPGLAVLRGAGFEEPSARPILSYSAIGSILLAPFGCNGLNIAALTSAVCLSPDAHPDPAKRYIAGISGGVTYLIFGAFAATVLALFAILPHALIAALAGLALFPVVATSLSSALSAEQGRDGALITFVVSASGMQLAGLGAAFWGLIFGLAVHFLQTHIARRNAKATA